MAQMGPFLNRAKLATKYRPGSWPLYRQETTPERPIWPSKRTISAPLETKATYPPFYSKRAPRWLPFDYLSQGHLHPIYWG